MKLIIPLKYACLTIMSVITLACSSNDGSKSEPLTSSGASGSSSSTSSSTSSSGAVSSYSRTELVNDLAGQIVEAYADTAEKFSQLANTSGDFCTDTADQDQFKALQQVWRDASLSWQYIQVISFGPASEGKRRQYISRYPLSPSDLSTAISKLTSATETITPGYIAAASAPAQGLPALEFLLFSDNAYSSFSAPETRERHCEIITSISSNLLTLLGQITTEWEVNGRAYTDFTNIDNTNDVLSDWFFDVAYNLVTVHDSKLGEALAGKTISIESPMALQSLQNIRANIQFIQDAFSAGGEGGLKPLLANEKLLNESTELELRLSLLLSELSTESPSIAELASSPEGLVLLQEKQTLIHNVFEYFAGPLVSKMGISLNLSLFGEGD